MRTECGGGRDLGIMFALPFSYFLHEGYITVRLGLRLSGLFALGAGQGLMGWWMVKSGLEVPPSGVVCTQILLLALGETRTYNLLVGSERCLLSEQPLLSSRGATI